MVALFEASLQPGDLSIALGHFFGHHPGRQQPVGEAGSGGLTL